MMHAAVPGSNASAARAGSFSAAGAAASTSVVGASSVRDAVLVRLSGSIDGVGISLLVAVLLIGLILISAGCGPPN
jgi:hypothetical protein